MSAPQMGSLLERTLKARGYQTQEEQAAFLDADLEGSWGAPKRIPGLARVAERLAEAVRAGERILIFGDYDADGVDATALMLLGLKELGVEPLHLIPNRLTDGYGLSEQILPRVIEFQPDVMLTVDNGITAAPEIARLQEQGIEVLVSDHHEAPEQLPDCPWVDPKAQAEDAQDATLAGAGVALKVLQAVAELLGKPGVWREFADIASVGTVGDAMPLGTQNRALVKAGLAQMAAQRRSSLQAILKKSGYGKQGPTAKDLAFGVCPRINAAGRLASPEVALQALLEGTPEQINELETINSERKRRTAEIVEEAAALASADEPVLLVGSGDFQRGLVGLAAAKLAERFNRPTIVYADEGEYATASARSVNGINVYDILKSCNQDGLFARFGGHAMAAAFTIATSALPSLRERLARVQLPPASDGPKRLAHDLDLTVDELDLQEIEELGRLEPCGNGNPHPLYRFRSAHITAARLVGAKKNHLSCRVDGCKAIWFSAEDWREPYGDVIAELAIDEFRGHREPQLIIKAIYPVADLPTFLEQELALPREGLHESQSEALAGLAQGQNILAVLPTGRGKSLIFQAFAAYQFQVKHQVSLFVYPLRALINDQQRHLESWGLPSLRLTGQSTPAEREQAYGAIREGKVAAILTTPEFLSYNAGHLDPSRIGFIAIDEAHHLATEATSRRPAYPDMAHVLAPFRQAIILACTATADPVTAKHIQEELGIVKTVSDDYRRPNLEVCDQRARLDADARLDYLARLIASEQKCIVYVNSRAASIQLCKDLRKLLPEQAGRILFYHGRLDHERRLAVESAFTQGQVTCVIATKAFGEGIDIPDVRHVVCYHLPFSRIEFNQLAGRAGRDGRKATIHLLYGPTDLGVNQAILDAAAPERDFLEATWRALMDAGKSKQDDPEHGFLIEPEESELICLQVFAELGLLEVRQEDAGSPHDGEHDSTLMRVRLRGKGARLEDSVIWQEGLRERERFGEFKDYALEEPATAIEAQISQAIRP